MSSQAIIPRNESALSAQAFASQARRPSRNAASSSDVLARQKILYFSDRGSNNTFTLTFGARKLEFSCAVSWLDHKWVEPMLESLCERWGQEKGWDGYDAEPTSEDCVQTLLTNIFPLMVHDSLPPIIVPLADGGVQAEWHYNNQTVEFEVPANGLPKYYYYNGAKVEEEEGLFKDNFSRLRTLIGNLQRA